MGPIPPAPPNIYMQAVLWWCLKTIISNIHFNHFLFRFQVPNDNLAETALNPVNDANTDSLSDLMTSIGLPMYTDLLLQHGCKSVEVFRNLRDTDFKACGVTDSSHIRKLVSVADLLRFRYEAKLQTGKVAKASMIKDKV